MLRWPTRPMPPPRGTHTRLRPGWLPCSVPAMGMAAVRDFLRNGVPRRCSRACDPLRMFLQLPTEVLVLYQELSDNRAQAANLLR